MDELLRQLLSASAASTSPLTPFKKGGGLLPDGAKAAMRTASNAFQSGELKDAVVKQLFAPEGAENSLLFGGGGGGGGTAGDRASEQTKGVGSDGGEHLSAATDETGVLDRLGWAGKTLREMQKQVKKVEATHAIVESHARALKQQSKDLVISQVESALNEVKDTWEADFEEVKLSSMGGWLAMLASGKLPKLDRTVALGSFFALIEIEVLESTNQVQSY